GAPPLRNPREPPPPSPRPRSGSQTSPPTWPVVHNSSRHVLRLPSRLVGADPDRFLNWRGAGNRPGFVGPVGYFADNAGLDLVRDREFLDRSFANPAQAIRAFR